MKVRRVIILVIAFTLLMCTAVFAETLPKQDKGTGPSPMAQQLDSLVTAGTITQAQENAVLEALKPSAEETATAPTAKSPAKQDLSKSMETKLSSLVTAGTITQAQLDSILAAIKPPEGGNGQPLNGEGKKPDTSAIDKAATSNVGKVVLKVGSSKMKVQGVEKDIDQGYNTAPVIKNNSTFVPIRAVIESLGGNIEWDATDKKTTITLENISVVLQVGSKSATVNGIAKDLDNIPFITDTGRVMLPVRFITENLGHSVKWDESSKSIIID